MTAERLLSFNGDSIQINEYYPGQGVDPHVDSKNNGELITILSLGSHTVLNFKNKKEQTIPMFLPNGSLFQMWGELRYKWTHSIEPKLYDTIDGIKLERTKRYSIVFRKSLIK